MITTVKIAWRNIWRTPLRSLIVIGSIVLGIWAGIFVIAFCYGLNSQRTVNRMKAQCLTYKFTILNTKKTLIVNSL